MPSAALICLGGEFDLDLGAEGAGDLFERRQRHPIVIPPLQARDVGLLHVDPPRKLGLGPALLSLARIKICGGSRRGLSPLLALNTVDTAA